MAEYTYTKAQVSEGNLHSQIKNNATITTGVVRVKWTPPDQLVIEMAATLSGAEETELDAVVAAHVLPMKDTAAVIRDDENLKDWCIKVTSAGALYTEEVT